VPAAQPAGNKSLRIAILVVVAALIGVGAWLAFGRSSNRNSNAAPLFNAIPPVSQSARELSNRALTLAQPLYWIGAKPGYHYEFSRNIKGYLYVRYLPKGVKAGEKPGKLLIVATYPLQHAYKLLKKGAHGRVVSGKRGSIVWVRTNGPQSVYIAWPKVPYEVEVYSPNASKAAKIAESGQVTTVG
jgi:hypothetical protein